MNARTLLEDAGFTDCPSLAASVPAPWSDVADRGCREALERLCTSRHRLAIVTLAQAPDRQGAAGDTTGAGSWPDLLGIGLRHWIVDKPWYAQAQAVAEVSKAAVMPWVQRNPGASIAIAVTAGAALVLAKPWRWDWLGRQWQGLPSAASAWVTRELSNPAAQGALLTSLATMLSQWAEGQSPGPHKPDAPAGATKPQATTPVE